jgi:hypothetical protein
MSGSLSAAKSRDLKASMCLSQARAVLEAESQYTIEQLFVWFGVSIFSAFLCGRNRNHGDRHVIF